MMPDKVPTYHIRAVYLSDGDLDAYLRAEWRAERAFLKRKEKGERPTLFDRLRLWITPRPADERKPVRHTGADGVVATACCDVDV